MTTPFNPLQGRLVGQQVVGKTPIARAGGMRMGPTGQVDDGIGQPQNMLQRLPTGQPIPVQPQPVQPTPAVQPQFGLSGAEQAMQAGLGAGVSAIEQGVGGALGTLQQGQNAVQQQLQQGQQSALGQLQQGQQSALNQLQHGRIGALGLLGHGAQALGGNFSANAAQVDPQTGLPLFQQAAQGVQSFSPVGLQAQEMQAALSGLRGQQAFDQALVDSPAQRFLREQGERAVINQATALGGLGGGNVLQELQRQGQGLAATQLQQQINNLAGLSGQGLQAAGMGGQFLSQAGQQQGNLAAQNAQLATQANLASAANRLSSAQGIANLFGQGAGLMGSLAGQGAGISSSLAGQGAGITSALTGQGAGLTGQFAGQGAGLQGQAGLNAANLFSGTGQNLANARLQAGRDIAAQIGQTTSGLSQLQQQQGGGLADIIGSGGANLANLLSGSGQLTAQQQMQLAQLLANLSTGQGTQLAGLQGQIGQAQAGGIMGRADALSGTLPDVAKLAAAFLSDKRLKKNILKIGSKKGINLYRWSWNGLLGAVGDAMGVLAQEVENIIPHAVINTKAGFKAVRYDLVEEYLNA